jgi:ABC-type transporter Mla MlaB component
MRGREELDGCGEGGPMNEMTNGARAGAGGFPVMEPAEAAGAHEERGLVLDLSGTKDLDQANLAFLLTVQQLAAQQDRDTWLTGVTLPLWHGLQAMGLGRFFRSLPASGGVRA